MNAAGVDALLVDAFERDGLEVIVIDSTEELDDDELAELLLEGSRS